jgi:hypothetical protein
VLREARAHRLAALGRPLEGPARPLAGGEPRQLGDQRLGQAGREAPQAAVGAAREEEARGRLPLGAGTARVEQAPARVGDEQRVELELQPGEVAGRGAQRVSPPPKRRA